MLSNEFLDEGLRDWAARAGLLGSAEKIAANSSKQMQVEKQAFALDFANQLQQEFIQKQQYFFESDSNTYKKFDQLLESFISEAPMVNITDWVTEFIDSKTKLFSMTPSDTTIKDQLINNFVTEANTTRKFPRNIAIQLGQWLYDVSIRQQRDSRGQVIRGTDTNQSAASAGATPLVVGAAPPDKNAFAAAITTGKTTIAGKTYTVPTLSVSNRVFTYDFTKNSWMDVSDSSNPMPMTDKASIAKLNRLYHMTYKI